MHALAALRGGDRTAYLGGQVSLSPIPHIRREPIGMLGVPLLTAFTNGWAVGWASTPYDPVWAARYPRRAALMAAAGPTGNLLIAVLALVCLRAGLAAGVFISPRQVSFHHLVEAASGAPWLTAVGEVLTVLLVLNVFLFVFNILPFPPLDGASVLGGLVPARRQWSDRGALFAPRPRWEPRDGRWRADSRRALHSPGCVRPVGGNGVRVLHGPRSAKPPPAAESGRTADPFLLHLPVSRVC